MSAVIASEVASPPATAAPAAQVAHGRAVERLVTGMATSDGAGVKLTRVLTQPLQRRLDPFLMLDAFGSDSADDYIGGFPDHPHRGFETITYMLEGRMRHRDSVGNVGLLGPGDVQWMTAGRGVIHSEMPEQEQGRMEGFQLWLNLPAARKMQAPWYRDIPSASIPQFDNGQGAVVRVIAGRSHGVAGAVERELTEPLYLDVHLQPGGRFEQPLDAGHNAFFYVYRGRVDLLAGEAAAALATPVAAGRMAILANGAPQADGVRIAAPADRAARLILIAGRPLNEPIAQYGPFVMNTEQEIYQAVRDFQTGVLAR
jgi:redox-sensitive bicupin YhaK (pirin superfamily)